MTISLEILRDAFSMTRVTDERGAAAYQAFLLGRIKFLRFWEGLHMRGYDHISVLCNCPWDWVPRTLDILQPKKKQYRSYGLVLCDYGYDAYSSKGASMCVPSLLNRSYCGDDWREGYRHSSMMEALFRITRERQIRLVGCMDGKLSALHVIRRHEEDDPLFDHETVSDVPKFVFQDIEIPGIVR